MNPFMFVLNCIIYLVVGSILALAIIVGTVPYLLFCVITWRNPLAPLKESF